jgi:hypothetical protein
LLRRTPLVAAETPASLKNRSFVFHSSDKPVRATCIYTALLVAHSVWFIQGQRLEESEVARPKQTLVTTVFSYPLRFSRTRGSVIASAVRHKPPGSSYPFAEAVPRDEKRAVGRVGGGRDALTKVRRGDRNEKGRG